MICLKSDLLTTCTPGDVIFCS